MLWDRFGFIGSDEYSNTPGVRSERENARNWIKMVFKCENFEFLLWSGQQKKTLESRRCALSPSFSPEKKTIESADDTGLLSQQKEKRERCCLTLSNPPILLPSLTAQRSGKRVKQRKCDEHWGGVESERKQGLEFAIFHCVWCLYRSVLPRVTLIFPNISMYSKHENAFNNRQKWRKKWEMIVIEGKSREYVKGERV